MARRSSTWLLIGLAGALSAGCGSSSSSSRGIASQPPQTILKSSVAAADSLKSVHAAGSIVSGGEHVAIDLHLLGGVGGRGQITLNGLAFQLVGVRNYAYMQAPSQVWQRAGAPSAAAQRLKGRWLRTPATGGFASVAQLTDLHKLFHQLLTPHGTLVGTGATSTVAGRPVVAVKSGEGTLYVAATGEPYPVELVKPGDNGGHITFDHFNEAITVAAPSNTIDLPQVSG